MEIRLIDLNASLKVNKLVRDTNSSIRGGLYFLKNIDKFKGTRVEIEKILLLLKEGKKWDTEENAYTIESAMDCMRMKCPTIGDEIWEQVDQNLKTEGLTKKGGMMTFKEHYHKQ